MPLFKAEAVVFTIHSGRAVEKSLEKFQNREMQMAMRAFLKACMPRIPVRTGFLKSAFRPMKNQFTKGAGADLDPGLAALFGANPELTKSRFEHARTHNLRGEKLSPAGQAARERQYEKEVRKNLRRYRKTKAGRAAGKYLRYEEWYYFAKRQRVQKTPTNALRYVTPKDAGDILKINGLTSTIQFDVQISYFRVNDFYTRITGSPWRSLDAGFQAFLNYVEKAARRYPFLSEVLTTSRIYLRGSRVGKEGDNLAADYRRRFGTQFYDPAGAIRGAKMDQYPGSGTKVKLQL